MVEQWVDLMVGLKDKYWVELWVVELVENLENTKATAMGIEDKVKEAKIDRCCDEHVVNVIGYFLKAKLFFLQ
jgi:hypothetical protein